jgi:hypothetical protein
MSKKLKIEITVVPTEGKSTKKTVEVAANGAKLGAALKAAGVSAENKDLLLNGKPATLETFVGPNDKVEARGQAKVQVAERPAGS